MVAYRTPLFYAPQHSKTGAKVRVQTLNGDLRDTFYHWYPGMAFAKENLRHAA
jgi:hypothetical protein